MRMILIVLLCATVANAEPTALAVRPDLAYTVKEGKEFYYAKTVDGNLELIKAFQRNDKKAADALVKTGKCGILKGGDMLRIDNEYMLSFDDEQTSGVKIYVYKRGALLHKGYSIKRVFTDDFLEAQ